MRSRGVEGRGLGNPSSLRLLWGEHWGIALVLVAFLILGCIYSVTTPIFEASDELWHYPFVKHLADGHQASFDSQQLQGESKLAWGLPVQRPGQVGPWRQEGSQPPLYYALGALLTKGIDTSDMAAVRQLNPHADKGLLTLDRNVNMVIHTPRERWPFRGTVLAVHLVRWMSLLMGAVTVLAGYLLARQVFPGDKVLALGAACLTAFNPMYLFITASVNNDALVIMLCAVCLWLMAKYVLMRPSVAQWALLGILLGLGSISKASALGMMPLAALTAGIVAWRERSWKELLVAGFALGLPIVLIGGWWYYRNWRLYHDPLGLSTFVAIVGARYPVPTLRQLLGEWRGFVMSYWGLFGGLNVAAPAWVYWALSAFGLVGLACVPVHIWRAHRAQPFASARWRQLGLIFLWPCIVFVSLVRWTLMTAASQGRLMFSALTAISLLTAMGLAGLMPRRLRAVLPAAMSVLMLGSALLLPFISIRPAYAAPRILSEKEVAALSPRLDVTFGGRLRLLSYALDKERFAPGDHLEVTLYWQSLVAMEENYSVFVHLLGANDLIIGQRDMYPGQGNYPTTLWSPGDIIRDTYVVPVSPVAMTPSEVQLEVGLYRLETGERLQVVDNTGAELGDSLRFGRLVLPSRTVNGIPNPVHFNLEERIALVGYELDHTAATPGEAFHLTLYWRALRDLDTNYSVFTHVLGAQDRIWAQMDGWPQKGQSPTSTWREGQLIADPYELTVVADAPPGVYDLEVGLYAADGKRLSVLGQGGRAQGTRMLLGKVRVLEAR